MKLTGEKLDQTVIAKEQVHCLTLFELGELLHYETLAVSPFAKHLQVAIECGYEGLHLILGGGARHFEQGFHNGNGKVVQGQLEVADALDHAVFLAEEAFHEGLEQDERMNGNIKCAFDVGVLGNFT